MDESQGGKNESQVGSENTNKINETTKDQWQSKRERDTKIKTSNPKTTKYYPEKC